MLRWIVFAPLAIVIGTIVLGMLDGLIAGLSGSDPGLAYALPVAVTLLIGQAICPAPRVGLGLLSLVTIGFALTFPGVTTAIIGAAIAIVVAIAWQLVGRVAPGLAHGVRQALRWLAAPVAAYAVGGALLIVLTFTVDEVEFDEPGLWHALPVACALLLGQWIAPVPRVALALLGLIALALTIEYHDQIALLGALAGIVVAATVTWRLRRDPDERVALVRTLRWTFFAPIGFIVFGFAWLELHLQGQVWEVGEGLAAALAIFTCSTLVAIFVAPGHRWRALLLFSAGTCVASFLVAEQVRWLVNALPQPLGVVRPEDLADGVLFVLWGVGTAFSALIVLLLESRKRRQALASTATTKCPRYKGTAPYQDSDLDRQTFFGREREARSLMSLVQAERLVVLFSKSGLGKSSLINAGLVQPLRERGYIPLVVRLVDQRQSLARTVIDAVEAAASKTGVEVAGADPTSLWTFFKTVEFWSEDDNLLRPVLVLDQFEEIFTLHGHAEREQFVQQLGELIRGRSSAGDEESARLGREPADVRVVLSMREDFLANLEDLARDIPAILQNRSRLGPLNREAARAAIVEPARLASDVFQTGQFSYEPAAADRIISFLANQREGEVAAAADEVEPVQLQLICSHLEETVRLRKSADGTELIIKPSDLGGDEQMKQVLRGFYDRIIDSVHPAWKADAVRRLCERQLIKNGRRIPGDQEDIQQTYRLSEQLLRRLVDARLLRAEPRLGGTFYEISHDRLVEPIQRSHNDFRVQRRRTGLTAIPLAVAVAGGFTSTIVESRQHQEYLASEERNLTSLHNARARDAVHRLALSHGYTMERLIEQMEKTSVVNPSVLVRLDFTRLIDRQRLAVLAHIGKHHDNFIGTSSEPRHDATFLGAVLDVIDEAERSSKDSTVLSIAAWRRCEVVETYERAHRAALDAHAAQAGRDPRARPRCDGGGRDVTAPGSARSSAVRLEEYQCFNPSHPAGKGKTLLVNRYEAAAYAQYVGASLPSSATLARTMEALDDPPDGWERWWVSDAETLDASRDPLLDRRDGDDPLLDAHAFTLVWPDDQDGARSRRCP